ncbi:periplasmic heavy metal sensor [Sphingomicrobium lutaoense]|nr:periplasmic heavy metal sensor [Sphingomicrobium lutaoense]
MQVTRRHIVLALLLAVLAGSLGALAASQWGSADERPSIHDFLHDELTLTPEQDAALDRVEEDFAAERQRLEEELRRANARLARAMEEEHRYGPKVSAAIDDVHGAMGELQKATMRHIFAMRELLDEEQGRAFDRQISRSLTGPQRE